MTDYMITGCGGFVAEHYLDTLEADQFKGSIVGIGTSSPKMIPAGLEFQFFELDMLDAPRLSALIGKEKPKYCVHLASRSSVAESWSNPSRSFLNNTNIFLNLLEAIRIHSPKTRLLSVGSSEQYARVGTTLSSLSELSPLGPGNPYSVARCAQEWLGITYVEGFGLDIVMTRSFNHLGPGQSSRFVLSGFARSFAKAILANNPKVLLKTGNLEVTRDFIDVRDVVKAYENILHGADSGEIFNVCSGNGTKLIDALDRLTQITGLPYAVKPDSSLIRPVENDYCVGRNHSISSRFGWAPTFPLKQSLEDLLNFWLTSENGS